MFTLFVLQSSAKFVIMLFFHPGFLFSIRPSACPLMPWNWTSKFRRTLTWRANADFNTGLSGTFWENKNVAVLYCKSLGGYHRNTATCGNKNHIQSPTIVQLGHITRNNGLCACQTCTWAIFEGALSLELCEMSHMWRGFKYGEKCVMHWPDVSKTRQGIDCVCRNHQCFGQHFGHSWIGVLNIAGILLSNALPANTCCFRMHSKHMWWFIVAQIIMFFPWNVRFFSKSWSWQLWKNQFNNYCANHVAIFCVQAKFRICTNESLMQWMMSSFADCRPQHVGHKLLIPPN